MRTLELPAGKPPREWGRIHGESFRGEVKALAAIRAYLCTRVGGFKTTEQVMVAAKAHLPVLERYHANLHAELVGRPTQADRAWVLGVLQDAADGVHSVLESVYLRRLGGSAGGDHLLGDNFDRCQVAPGEKKVGPFRRKGACDSAADRATGSVDHRDLVLEHHFGFPFRVRAVDDADTTSWGKWAPTTGSRAAVLRRSEWTRFSVPERRRSRGL